MKSIIISGNGRTGKTTLARKINEELNHFVINVDKLVAIFHGAYPQLNIRFGAEGATDNLAPFLGHFLGAFTSGQGVAYNLRLRAHAVKGNRFVLEGVHFDFDRIMPVLNTYGIEELKDEFTLIGLVQRNKTVDDLFNDLRKYDTEDDWTYHFDDDELRERCHEAMDQSMIDHLEKYGFTFYDTSTEREKVFDRIIDDIKSDRI